jgi:hypothetical protein
MAASSADPMDAAGSSDEPRISPDARADNTAELVYADENTVARVPPTIRLDGMFANSSALFDRLRSRLERGANTADGERPFANLQWSRYTDEMGETLGALWVLLFAMQVGAVSDAEPVDIRRAWRFFQRQTSLWFARAGAATSAGIDRLVRDEAGALASGLLALRPYINMRDAASALARASSAESAMSAAKTNLYAIADVFGVQTGIVGTNMSSVAAAVIRTAQDHLLAQTQHLLVSEYTLLAMRDQPDEDTASMMKKTVSSAAKMHVELLEAKAKIAELEKSIKTATADNTVSSMQRTINKLKLELASTKGDNASKDVEIKTLRDAIKKNTDASTAELQMRLATAQAECAANAASVSRLGDENAKLTAENLTLRAANKGLTQAAKTDENTQLRERVRAQDAEMAQMRVVASIVVQATIDAAHIPDYALRALRDVRGRVDPTEIAELKTKNEKLQIELTACQNDLKLRKNAQQAEINRLHELIARPEAQAVEIARLTTERDTETAAKKAFQAQNEALLKKHADLEKRLADARKPSDPAEVAALKAKAAELEVQLAACKDEMSAKRDAQRNEIARLRMRDAEFEALKATADAAEENKQALESVIRGLRAKTAELEAAAAAGEAAPILAALRAQVAELEVTVNRQAAELKAKRDAKDVEIKRLTDLLAEQLKKSPDIEQIKWREAERDRARADYAKLETAYKIINKTLQEEGAALRLKVSRLEEQLSGRPDIDQLRGDLGTLSTLYVRLSVNHNMIAKSLLKKLRQ